jgi:peptidyl-prolyl cis-trans isomerase B (cyclophilin B)
VASSKKQRQRQLARDAYERRLQRQAEREQRAKKWTAATIVAVVVVGIGVLSAFLAGAFHSSPAKPVANASHSPTATVSVTASPSPTASASPTPTTALVNGKCVYTASGTAARKVSPPPSKPDTKASYRATIATNRGNVVIDLLNSQAPCTVNSFVSLADQGFFNKTPCPRLSNSSGLYILQCGDPTGTGSGGPGYMYASENLTGATYPAGTIAMANSGAPDSNGSQFFLVFQNTSLPPSYTPFGHVVSGLNILQNVGKRGFGPPLNSFGGGAPKEKVEIESVTIKKT